MSKSASESSVASSIQIHVSLPDENDTDFIRSRCASEQTPRNIILPPVAAHSRNILSSEIRQISPKRAPNIRFTAPHSSANALVRALASVFLTTIRFAPQKRRSESFRI